MREEKILESVVDPETINDMKYEIYTVNFFEDIFLTTIFRVYSPYPGSTTGSLVADNTFGFHLRFLSR